MDLIKKNTEASVNHLERLDLMLRGQLVWNWIVLVTHHLHLGIKRRKYISVSLALNLFNYDDNILTSLPTKITKLFTKNMCKNILSEGENDWIF